MCGIALPAGLHDGSRLDPAIFTPATKDDAGHDENISFERMIEIVGPRRPPRRCATRSIAIYEEARALGWERGLVLADTKFEFGRVDGALTLIDEVAVARFVALLGPRRVRGRPAAVVRQAVRARLARPVGLEPRAAGAGAARRRGARRRSERYLEAMRRLTGRRRRDTLARRPRCSRSSDKRGAAEFARALAERGTRILASGGTAQHLAQAGVAGDARSRSGPASRELLGGRVKTLHPHVHAPILARRAVARATSTALAERGLEPIDLVAVTLYPFEAARPALDDAGAVEEIDIGGVALLRGGGQEPRRRDRGARPRAVRRGAARRSSAASRRRAAARWALADVRAHARATTRAIAARAGAARGGGRRGRPPVHSLALERARTLRYGENPHQPAALYAARRSAARLAAHGREGRSSRTTTCSTSKPR